MRKWREKKRKMGYIESEGISIKRRKCRENRDKEEEKLIQQKNVHKKRGK